MLKHFVWILLVFVQTLILSSILVLVLAMLLENMILGAFLAPRSAFYPFYVSDIGINMKWYPYAKIITNLIIPSNLTKSNKVIPNKATNNKKNINRRKNKNNSHNSRKNNLSMYLSIYLSISRSIYIYINNGGSSIRPLMEMSKLNFLRETSLELLPNNIFDEFTFLQKQVSLKQQTK